MKAITLTSLPNQAATVINDFIVNNLDLRIITIKQVVVPFSANRNADDDVTYTTVLYEESSATGSKSRGFDIGD